MPPLPGDHRRRGDGPAQRGVRAAPVEGETYPLGRDPLDLEPVLREALALALPLAPLCDEACAGPDPEAHPVGTRHAARTDEDERRPAGRPPVVGPRRPPLRLNRFGGVRDPTRATWFDGFGGGR